MLALLASCLVWALAAGGAAAQCVVWGPFRVTGTLPKNLPGRGVLSEVSGVVASRHNEGVLWVHDDGGHGPYLVALRRDGRLAQQYLVGGVRNVDWEDVALGPGPQPGRGYLYLGDFGDNARTRTDLAIVRVPEPVVPPRPGPVRTLQGAEVFRFRYPPGRMHDAETLLVDPVDGAPYVLTKELLRPAALYRYPLPLDRRAIKTLRHEGDVRLGVWLTAGDVSADGGWIHVRDYGQIYHLRRPRGTRFAAAFANRPCTTLALQGQAEALALDPDGLGLVAISEGAGAPIRHARGKLPNGPQRAIPSWWCFGTGLAGAGGIPGLGPLSAPVLGARLRVGVFAGRPGGRAFLVFSTTALPDGKVPFAGGWAHVLPEVALPVTMNGRGEAVVDLGVAPDVSALRGRRLHAQGVHLDPAASQGVALSAGLTLLLDR